MQTPKLLVSRLLKLIQVTRQAGNWAGATTSCLNTAPSQEDLFFDKLTTNNERSALLPKSCTIVLETTLSNAGILGAKACRNLGTTPGKQALRC